MKKVRRAQTVKFKIEMWDERKAEIHKLNLKR
jgi:hypothetical protein